MRKAYKAVNMAGVTFKVGDRVRILASCNGTEHGDIYNLKLTQYGKLAAGHDVNEGSGCTCIDNWERLDSEWDQ